MWKIYGSDIFFIQEQRKYVNGKTSSKKFQFFFFEFFLLLINWPINLTLEIPFYYCHKRLKLKIMNLYYSWTLLSFPIDLLILFNCWVVSKIPSTNWRLLQLYFLPKRITWEKCNRLINLIYSVNNTLLYCGHKMVE